MRRHALAAALLLLVTACGEAPERLAEGTPTATPDETPGGTPSKSPASGPESAKKVSLLFWHRFDQEQAPEGSVSKFRLVRAGVDGANPITFPGEYTEVGRPLFLASQDGRYLAQADDRRVALASASELPSFRTVFELSDRDATLHGVAWAPDGSALAVLSRKPIGSEDPDLQAEYRAFVLHRDGEVMFARTFRAPFISLRGVDLSKGEVYWVETPDGGGWKNFTALRVQDGTFRHVEELRAWAYRARLHMSLDGSKAYWLEGDRPDQDLPDRIILFDFLTSSKRVVYKLDAPSPTRFIDPLIVAPDESAIVFSVAESVYRRATYLMTLPEGRVSELLTEERYRFMSPAAWSPEGRYLWFVPYPGCSKHTCAHIGEYYTLDLSSGEVIPFFRARKFDEYGAAEEWLTFAAWLVE